MSFRLSAFVLGTVLIIPACAHGQQVKVNLNSVSTTPVPDLIRNRTVIEGALVGESMDGFAGYVLKVFGRETGGRCDMTTINASDVTPNSFVTAEIPVRQTKFTPYQSIVDKKAALDVKVFVFAANMSAEDRAEVMVQDVSEQSVPSSKLDIPALVKLAKQPLPPNVCGRYIIRKAVLTIVSSKKFTKVEGGGNVSGLVFSVGGQAYYSTDQFENAPYLSIEARDIADLAVLAARGDRIDDAALSNMTALTSPMRIQVTTRK